MKIRASDVSKVLGSRFTRATGGGGLVRFQEGFIVRSISPDKVRVDHAVQPHRNSKIPFGIGRYASFLEDHNGRRSFEVYVNEDNPTYLIVRRA